MQQTLTNRSVEYGYFNASAILLFAYRLTFCRKLPTSMKRTSDLYSRNWRAENRGFKGNCLKRDAWNHVCRAWSLMPSSSGRRNV